MDVKLVKLVCGDVICCEVKRHLEQATGEPMVKLVHPVHLEPTNRGLAVIPYPLFSSGDDITVRETDVVFVTSAADEVAQGYAKHFGGIIVAPANAIGD